MEKITTYNYEAFYLDYLEGNLDENGQAMLFDFLDANPTLKSELELDDDILDFTLSKESNSLTRIEKEDLKHFDYLEGEICLNNVSDFMIADVENEMSIEKKIALDEFIIEHKLQESRDYFYATKLKVDLSEIYPNKGELKKKGTVIPLFVKIGSIAAIGLLMFNLINDSGGSSEIYSPRNGEFALDVDSSNQFFEINSKITKPNQDSYATVDSNDFGNNEVEKEMQSKDTVITPSFNLNPSTDIVKKEDNKNDNPISPLEKEDKTPIVPLFEEDDNIVSANSTSEIKLVDMYKPITNLTNSYTNLNVSYQKSVAESDYQVTAFSIGKFSFERKKRK